MLTGHQVQQQHQASAKLCQVILYNVQYNAMWLHLYSNILHIHCLLTFLMGPENTKCNLIVMCEVNV